MKKTIIVLVTALSMASGTTQAGLLKKIVKGAVVVGAGAVAAKAIHAKVQENNQAGNLKDGLPLMSRIEGTVIGVSDGDTVVVNTMHGRHTVRLRGIDAPETTCHDITGRDLDYCNEGRQPYGKEAKAYLLSMVMGQTVTLVTGKQGASHGRTVANIFLGTHDINLEMVRQGLAWHESRLTPDETMKQKVAYALAMHNARKQSIGLWSENNPVRPSDYRRKN